MGTRRWGWARWVYQGGSVEGVPSPGAAREVTVSFRCQYTGTAQTVTWDAFSAEQASAALPWRSFRWFDGQRHYSGSYWAATEQALVGYESRLELARLLLADFDSSVSRIVSQPFVLQARVSGRARRHVPDYFLLTCDGPVVVDVKPTEKWTKPNVAFTFAWTRKEVERRGWMYEIWGRAPQALMANIRFLAGYRDQRRFDEDLVNALLTNDFDDIAIEDASRFRDAKWPMLQVRAALFHLLWRQALHTDLSRPLSGRSLLSRGARLS